MSACRIPAHGQKNVRDHQTSSSNSPVREHKSRVLVVDPVQVDQVRQKRTLKMPERKILHGRQNYRDATRLLSSSASYGLAGEQAQVWLLDRKAATALE